MHLPTRPLLAATGAAFLVVGISLSFLAGEALEAAGIEPVPAAVLGAQLLAGLYGGLGLLNWMEQRRPIGGIYGRPIVVANLLHAMVAAPAALRAGEVLGAGAWGLGAAYVLLVLAFGRLFFQPPRTEG